MRLLCKIVKRDDGSNGIELVESLPAKPIVEPSPELTGAQLENFKLNHELEAEYRNHPRRFRKSLGNSMAAHKKFSPTIYKSSQQVRTEYWQELKEACAKSDSVTANPVEREETSEDVIKKFGGSFVGCSEVMPHQVNKRTVLFGE